MSKADNENRGASNPPCEMVQPLSQIEGGDARVAGAPGRDVEANTLIPPPAGANTAPSLGTIGSAGPGPVAEAAANPVFAAGAMPVAAVIAQDASAALHVVHVGSAVVLIAGVLIPFQSHTLSMSSGMP